MDDLDLARRIRKLERDAEFYAWLNVLQSITLALLAWAVVMK